MSLQTDGKEKKYPFRPTATCEVPAMGGGQRRLSPRWPRYITPPCTRAPRKYIFPPRRR